MKTIRLLPFTALAVWGVQVLAQEGVTFKEAYNSWPARPEYDSRWRTMASGDTYQVYPYGRSSMRFERLVDGIEAYEKMKVLRAKCADRLEILEPLEVKLNDMASKRLTDTNQPWHGMMSEVVDMLNEISKELSKQEKHDE